jgi:hypothetical protein
VPAVLVAAGVGALLEAHQLGVLGVGREERVHLQLAEAPGERHVLGGGQVPVTEEDHLVGEQRRPQLGDRVVVEVGGQVDAGQLGADGGTDRGGLESLPVQLREPRALPGQVPHRSHHRGVAGQVKSQAAQRLRRVAAPGVTAWLGWVAVTSCSWRLVGRGSLWPVASGLCVGVNGGP